MTNLAPTQSSRWKRLWYSLTNNPITIKELRSRMRGRRAFTVLTIYLLFAIGLVGLIYTSVTANSTPSPTVSRDAGQATFVTILSIQTFLVLFMAPAFTAGAVSGERERQTYDLLRTTLLSPRDFVLGKLISALSYVVLLIIAAIPLLSLSFILGGIVLAEVVVSQLLLVFTALAYAMLGLYFSTITRSTMAASVSTYATTFFLTVGLPLLVLLFGSIFAAASFTGSTSWLGEMILTYGGMSLAAINLPATLTMSDVVLREEGSLWGFFSTIGGYRMWIFSPWYFNLLFHSLMALFLFRRTARHVGVIANK